MHRVTRGYSIILSALLKEITCVADKITTAYGACIAPVAAAAENVGMALVKGHSRS